MTKKPTAFAMQSGERVEFGTWRDMGHGFSLRPLRTTYHLRHDATGEIVKPPGHGPCRDNLMMALFYGKIPNYARFAFSREHVQHIPAADIY